MTLGVIVVLIAKYLSQTGSLYVQFHWYKLIGTANAEVIMMRVDMGKGLLRGLF